MMSQQKTGVGFCELKDISSTLCVQLKITVTNGLQWIDDSRAGEGMGDGGSARNETTHTSPIPDHKYI